MVAKRFIFPMVGLAALVALGIAVFFPRGHKTVIPSGPEVYVATRDVPMGYKTSDLIACHFLELRHVAQADAGALAILQQERVWESLRDAYLASPVRRGAQLNITYFASSLPFKLTKLPRPCPS